MSEPAEQRIVIAERGVNPCTRENQAIDRTKSGDHDDDRDSLTAKVWQHPFQKLLRQLTSRGTSRVESQADQVGGVDQQIDERDQADANNKRQGNVAFG